MQIKNALFIKTVTKFFLCGYLLLLAMFFCILPAFFHTDFNDNLSKNENALSPSMEYQAQFAVRVICKFLLFFILFNVKFHFQELSSEKQNVHYFCKITAYWLFKKALLFSPRELVP